jgi:poly(hydroxyalkanoate) granule-associated protein
MMATRNTSNRRSRTRRPAGGPSSGSGPDRAEAAREAQRQLLQGVQQAWLAGMGAIARAQKEGPAAFAEAAQEGLRLLGTSRSAARQMVRDAFENAQDTLQTRVGGARSQAQETWDNLEALFQGRVQRAMHQLGVPTAEEIRALTRRVAELNESVRRLEARDRTSGGGAAKRRATPAVGRKRTTRRKSA